MIHYLISDLTVLAFNVLAGKSPQLDIHIDDADMKEIDRETRLLVPFLPL